VKKAWLAEQKALAWQKAYQDLRAKYIVLLPRRLTMHRQAAKRRERPLVKPWKHGIGWLLAVQLLALLFVPLVATAHESRRRISLSTRRRQDIQRPVAHAGARGHAAARYPQASRACENLKDPS